MAHQIATAGHTERRELPGRVQTASAGFASVVSRAAAGDRDTGRQKPDERQTLRQFGQTFEEHLWEVM